MPLAIGLKIKSNARIVVKSLERLRKAIPEISRKRLYDAAVEVRAEMKEPGADPIYPIHWDSDKQRRAYFATDGFGAGIPYKRKGTYEKNWKVVPIGGSNPTAQGYDVVNDLPQARYIAGTSRGAKQSNIHKGRWNVFREVFDRVVAKLPKTVQRSVATVARQIGFKVK